MSKLLTPQEAGERIGVSKHAIWQFIREEKLKAVKLSERRTRIPEESLEEYINTYAKAKE